MSISKTQQLKDTRFRKRKCRTCKTTFRPTKENEVVCSVDCAIPFGRELVQKANRKAKKQFRAEDKSILMKLAQTTFNKYIRLRDKDLPCISCGHTGSRQRHSSHFRPVGRNGQHRFNEDNAHSSCSICNTHLSGNLVPYREALIKKIGIERVEALEQNNIAKTYSVDELKSTIDKYKRKCNGMQD